MRIDSPLCPEPHTLQQIIDGNQEAFGYLVESWIPTVKSLAAKITPNSFDRDDYKQEGLLALCEVILSHGMELSGEAFNRYAYVAIQNRMRDTLRRAVSHRGFHAYVDPRILSDEVEHIEDLPEIDYGLYLTWYHRLEGRQRDIFDAVYKRGESQASVALRLDLSRARVSQIVSSIVEDLRRHVTAQSN